MFDDTPAYCKIIKDSSIYYSLFSIHSNILIGLGGPLVKSSARKEGRKEMF